MTKYEVVYTMKEKTGLTTIVIVTPAVKDEEIIEICDVQYCSLVTPDHNIRIKFSNELENANSYVYSRVIEEKDFETSLKKSNCLSLMEGNMLYRLNENERKVIKTYSEVINTSEAIRTNES